jgi:superfamily II DNA or RNA helicase
VRELEAVGPDLARKLEVARVEAEERYRQWEEESRLRKEAEERALRERRRKEAREELLVAISGWDQARRIADYFDEVAHAAERLDGEERSALQERIAKARELVGELAPLDLLRRWKAPEER